jgi:hypothetical protein
VERWQTGRRWQVAKWLRRVLGWIDDGVKTRWYRIAAEGPSPLARSARMVLGGRCQSDGIDRGGLLRLVSGCLPVLGGFHGSSWLSEVLTCLVDGFEADASPQCAVHRIRQKAVEESGDRCGDLPLVAAA